MPDRDDLEEIAVAAFGTHLVNQYLPFSFSGMTRANASRYLRIEGESHLREALGRGRGVVLMHPHMGPAQLPLCVLGLMGYPMHQVGGGRVAGLSVRGERAAAFRHDLEKALPATMHDGRGFLRPVLRALSAGGVVMATCDGTGGGEELGRRLVRSVFGQPMKLPVGALYLALRAEAPLLTLHTFWNPERRPVCVARIGPEVPLDRAVPLPRGLELGADLVAAFLEEVLRARPEDWHFWDQFEPGRFLVGEGPEPTEPTREVA